MISISSILVVCLLKCEQWLQNQTTKADPYMVGIGSALNIADTLRMCLLPISHYSEQKQEQVDEIQI
jgi:hypothetical protein